MKNIGTIGTIQGLNVYVGFLKLGMIGEFGIHRDDVKHVAGWTFGEITCNAPSLQLSRT